MAENPTVLGVDERTASDQPDDRVLADQDATFSAREPETQAYVSDARNDKREIKRLRRHLRWLTGLSLLAIIALGGTIAGLTWYFRNEQIRLKNQQNQLTQQLKAISPNGATTQRIESLESQLTLLNKQVQDLNKPELRTSLNQLNAIQYRLQSLEARVRENPSDAVIVGQLKEMNERLRRLQPNQNNRGGSSSQSNSEESNSSSRNSTSSNSSSSEGTRDTSRRRN